METSMDTSMETNIEFSVETDTATNAETDNATNAETDDEVSVETDITTNPETNVEIMLESDVEIDADEIQILSEKNIFSTGQRSLTDLYAKRNGSFFRPPLSYACLIYLAFKNSPLQRMRVTQVYTFITKYFPYYSANIPIGWKNSIRHNLSMNRNFSKHIVDPESFNHERHCLWMLTPARKAKMDGEMRDQMKKHWNFLTSRCVKSTKQLTYIMEGTVNKKEPVALESNTLPGRPHCVKNADLKFTTLELDDKRLGVILYSRTVPLPPDFYSEEYSINPLLPDDSTEIEIL